MFNFPINLRTPTPTPWQGPEQVACAENKERSAHGASTPRIEIVHCGLEAGTPHWMEIVILDRTILRDDARDVE